MRAIGYLVGFVVMCCAVAVPAQQEAARGEGATQDAADRGTVLGFVIDESGGKRAGADVLLVSRPLPQRQELGELDAVRVVSGADGRFRAQCLRGRSYSAWATWTSEAGDRMGTAVVEGVVPGPVVELGEAKKFEPPALRLVDLDAWRKYGEVTAAAYMRSTNAYGLPIRIGANGEAELPWMTGADGEIEVRGANGTLIAMAFVLRRNTELALSAPHAVSVRVVDAAGQPIAGATVSQAPHHSAGARHPRLPIVPLAETDAAGNAKVILPSVHPNTGRVGAQYLTVKAKGYGTSLLHLPAKKGTLVTEATLTMREGFALSGCIVDTDGKALPNIDVMLESPVTMDGRRDGRWNHVPTVTRTGDDGRFVFEGVNGNATCNVMLALPPGEARAAGIALDPGRAAAPLQWVAALPKIAKDHDLGDLCLAQLPVCKVQIVTADGVPAAGARVRMTHDSAQFTSAEFVTDRVGRLQAVFPGGGTTIGVYVPGGGIGYALAPSPKSHEMRLALMRTRQITGVVVDEDGDPVEGVEVRPWDRPIWRDSTLADLAYKSFLQSAPTGADGSFRVTLPLADREFGLLASKVDDRGVRSRITAVAPDQDEVRVMVVDRRRR